MKKATKILTIILIVALLCGVLSGCAMFGRNVSKYRGVTAVQVGNQNITIGKILDTFNNYYNNYSAYISQGYVTVDSLIDMTMNSLYNQYLKVDDYVSKHTPTEHALSELCDYAGFLSLDEMLFCVNYIKYLTFNSFDSSVLSQIEAKYDLKDEETEDTSRDFTELDKLDGYDTYADYLYHNNFVNKDANEYFEDYYKDIDLGEATDISKYVYATAEQAAAKLEKLNKRVEGEEKITFEEYADIQTKVVKQYKTSIKNSYAIEFETFVKNQIADMVVSCIVAKYNYEVYKTIESDSTQSMQTKLTNNYNTLKESQKAGFALNGNFESFIQGLSANSFIYDVPEKYTDSYVFVKNILIPFNATQTAILSNLEKELGTKDNANYKAIRNEFASKIVADDFNSEKDADGNYSKIENVFDLDGDNIVINSACTELSNYFTADGSVDAKDYASKEEAVIALMKRFNTDTAQHTAQYDYVVRVDEAPADYKHQWVDEFVQATKFAVENGRDYALAVSDYGVHIIFISGKVGPQVFDFSGKNYLNPAAPEYRFFKTYFESQSNLLLEDNLTALKKSYVDANKIVKNKQLDKFLKNNGLKYDFEKALKGDEE